MQYQNRNQQGLLAKLWLGTVGRFCLFWEKLRGASTFSEVFAPARLSAKLVATSLLGYKLSVFCQRRHYQRIYDRFFVPTRHHVIYQISGVVSADAPPALKQACGEVTLSISTNVHWAVDEDFQERLVTQAYLDLLIAHLKRHAPSMKTA
jgi:hypothetical protein